MFFLTFLKKKIYQTAQLFLTLIIRNVSGVMAADNSAFAFK